MDLVAVFIDSNLTPKSDMLARSQKTFIPLNWFQSHLEKLASPLTRRNSPNRFKHNSIPGCAVEIAPLWRGRGVLERFIFFF